MASVIMCSNSGAQENKICHCFYFFPSICQEVIVSDASILVFSFLSFKPAFHSSLLASSRGSLVPFEFLPLEWYHLNSWGCWYFSQQSWSQIGSSSPTFSMMYSGFSHGSDGKETICNAGDPRSTPGLGRSPGEVDGYWLQYSCLENSMDRGAWWATVCRVTNRWTWLSN